MRFTYRVYTLKPSEDRGLEVQIFETEATVLEEAVQAFWNFIGEFQHSAKYLVSGIVIDEMDYI